MAKNTRKKVAEIEAQATNNGQADYIGYKVWWDLIRCHGSLADLHINLVKFNLDEYEPEEMSPEIRLKHAGIRAGRKHHVEFKKAGKRNGHTTFRPVKMTKATDSTAQDAIHQPTIDPKVLTSLSVNRDTGVVVIGDPSCEVGKAVISEYAKLQGMFLADQIRVMVKRVLEKGLNGTPIRQQGGLYFIPKDTNSDTILYDLQKVIQDIGDCDLYIEKVAKGSDSSRAATKGTIRSLDGLYAEILVEAENFISTMDGGTVVNTKSLNAKADAARNLKKRVDLYKDILEDRGKALSKAAKIVASTMGEIVEASVEVKSLKKAAKSERAQSMANDLLKEISEKAHKNLSKARNTHQPVEDNNE